MPIDRLVCDLLHSYTNDTMIYSNKLRLDCLRIGLNIALNCLDDLVVDNSLEFCDILEKEFSANLLGFGSHYYFWLHQIWWDDLRRGPNYLLLVAFGFPNFGGMSNLGAWIHCAQMLLVSLKLVFLSRVGL